MFADHIVFPSTIGFAFPVPVNEIFATGKFVAFEFIFNVSLNVAPEFGLNHTLNTFEASGKIVYGNCIPTVSILYRAELNCIEEMFKFAFP